MKYMLYVLSFIMPLYAFSDCIDFSGRYKSKTDALSISQVGCSELTMEYIFPPTITVTRHLVFDNQKRTVFTSTEMISEESSTINSNEIYNETTDTYIRENKKYQTITHWTLSQDNLIEKIEHMSDKGSVVSSEVNVYLKLSN